MKRVIFLFAVTITLILGACSDLNEDQVYREADKLPAASLLEADDANYSSWVALLKYTELFNTMNLDKSYTCFVPDNGAMNKYLQKKGVSSVQELNKEEAANLVRYHLIALHKYTTSEFSDGIFPDSTATGDYLSLDMRDGGFDAMYINNEARIKKFNMKATNAVIHTLDAVLTPVTGMIMDNLNTEQFSVMIEALNKTGYGERLALLYDQNMKNRFTLFAVPNAVFAKAGITDFASLAAYLGASDADYTSAKNIVNRYVAYHITSVAYSYANLNADINNTTSKNISMLAANTLMSCGIVNDVFYLNYKASTSTGVTITEKNLNCKNGVIHVVDGLLEIVIPKATTVKWDITDYPELGAICEKYQLANQSTTYNKLLLGMYELPCYMSPSTNYHYYLANKNEVAYKCVNHDCLLLDLGKYGWIQMKSPMIIAGKYKVSLAHYNIAAKTKAGKWALIIDGEYVGATVTTIGESTSKSTYSTVQIGEVVFTESVAHTVRFLAGDENMSYLDCLIFEPIN